IQPTELNRGIVGAEVFLPSDMANHVPSVNARTCPHVCFRLCGNSVEIVDDLPAPCIELRHRESLQPRPLWAGIPVIAQRGRRQSTIRPLGTSHQISSGGTGSPW